MKYKYLKRFNESNGGDLSFSDFKEIMSEITDEFDFEYEFMDESTDTEGPRYEFSIKMDPKFEIHIDDLNTDLKYLDPMDGGDEVPWIGWATEPTKLEPRALDEVNTEIDENISRLVNLKDNLDNIIKLNTDAKKLFKILKNTILPRFEQFSNFGVCLCGIEYGTLFITFEIPNEE